jgi:hypothetical protein
MKELPPPGAGNGGRTCFGCSCVLLMFTALVTLVMFVPPMVLPGISYADTLAMPDGYWWSTPTCLSSCCCVGVFMFFLAIGLIMVDDPAKPR